METERVACPMCGWWRTILFGIDQKTGKAREVRFDKVDPATAPMWRLERLTGAGRASREAKIELIDSKGIKDLPDDLKEQIKAQCHRILKTLEEE